MKNFPGSQGDKNRQGNLKKGGQGKEWKIASNAVPKKRKDNEKGTQRKNATHIKK